MEINSDLFGLNLSSLCRREKSHILISEIKNLSSKNWAVNYKASSDTNSWACLNSRNSLQCPTNTNDTLFYPWKNLSDMLCITHSQTSLHSTMGKLPGIFRLTCTNAPSGWLFLISGYCACWECFISQPRSHIGIKWASGVLSLYLHP